MILYFMLELCLYQKLPLVLSVISSGVNFLWSCYISAPGFLNGHKDFIATYERNATDTLPWEAVKHRGMKLQRCDRLLDHAVDRCCVSDNVRF